MDMKTKRSNLVSKKNAAKLSAVFLSVFLILSCNDKNKSQPVVEEPPVSEPEPAPVDKQPEPETAPEPAVEPEPVPEPVQEPVVVEEKSEPVPEPEDEYSRSVGTVSVSRDTFAEDKDKILKIISELDTVMKDFDYRSWLTYVDQETIDYWSRPVNLRKAQNRLPVKGLRLSSLQDYFKYVFVPARKGRQVTEIRYISDKYIKAIEVGEEQDIVYYYFNKIDGRWMVHIPPLDD